MLSAQLNVALADTDQLTLCYII